MSGGVFSETLQEITNTKLDELSRRRAAFEDARAAVLSSLGAEADPLRRLILLGDGARRCFGLEAGATARTAQLRSSLDLTLSNTERFVALARHDPSVSGKIIADHERALVHELDVQSQKYRYAALYGQLVTEWLAADQNPGRGPAQGGEGDDAEMVDVESAARLRSREEWEDKVFAGADIDADSLHRYLDGVFGPADAADEEVAAQKRLALGQVRAAVADFERTLSAQPPFTHVSLRWAIDGLMASDLVTNEQREVLRDFRSNGVILSEVADVLNMRISALGSWGWGRPGVPVEQRRKVSGVFGVHIHEDLLQAIFLQYIGVRWSAFLRATLTTFRKSPAWSSLARDIPLAERRRLEYYVGPVRRRRCLQKARQKRYSADYFVAKLLRSTDMVIKAADGELEANYSSLEYAAPAPKRKIMGGGLFGMRRQAVAQPFGSQAVAGAQGEEGEEEDESDAEEDDDKNVKTPVAAKQQLLHLLSAEIAIHTRLSGELTALHAVLEDFETSLPHDTIITVLRYLGVSRVWLDFFVRFLRVPLRWDDGLSAPPKVQLRGVPASHVLSDVFGEAVLFCLDYAVNQAALGQPLWRYGGDMWFWSPDHATAVTVWGALETFALATGTSLNSQKCGAVRIARDSSKSRPLDKALPAGQIRWGFLVLSPQTGQFEVDTKMIDTHVEELRRQLAEKQHSILAFIQTWNVYVGTFLTSNFGRPCNCFGRAHVDAVLAAHQHIQRRIFAGDRSRTGFEASSSIIDYLKTSIAERFGITDVPDGYFYFPTDLGGLDLQSPFISLLYKRDAVLDSHESLIQRMLEAERSAYNRIKARFEAEVSGAQHMPFGINRSSGWKPESEHGQVTFMSFEQFGRYREDLCILFDRADGPLDDVYAVFKKLMEEPEDSHPTIPPGHWVDNAIGQIQLSEHGGPIHSPWNSMKPYWKWIAKMYGPEIVEKFGGFNIVDRGLLPMGMVGLFREKRVTWKG